MRITRFCHWYIGAVTAKYEEHQSFSMRETEIEINEIKIKEIEIER